MENINIENGLQQTPLHVAAIAGSVACLTYLVEKKADVDAQDIDFKTALHYAAENGRLECVTYLVTDLAKKCETNVLDSNLNTPLHLAALNGHKDCMQILIENKANIHLTNRNFQTAEELSKSKEQQETCSESSISSKSDMNSSIKESCPIGVDKNYLYGVEIMNLLNSTAQRFEMGSPTKGDGNCFYRAVVDQLTLHDLNRKGITHSTLRQEVVELVTKEYNKSSRHEAVQIFVTNSGGHQSFEKELLNQKIEGEYATEVFVCFTAVYLGFAIKIFNINNVNGVDERLIPSKLLTESSNDETDHLCVALYKEHYQSIVDLSMKLMPKHNSGTSLEEYDQNSETARGRYKIIEERIPATKNQPN